ncbi:mechanosensitive ion channel domain-containing protein [Psychromonas sp. 14N.309.X.WAT.B.A12]|uniref:mechanosensitive ion channel domain-containing protein n=1 Tax=unclassified Psychromonas TaxID=2614957 RepID=UPI0025B072A6|nr:mechanosensitive ion channel domain-containing protein [Psychromonas sp. 14N.309.X.WAT.B.A12]MDN2664917.1 mechanosensitive ion channel [Psychromonas sp. 14N.309.X.WAT.B.A12]
MSEESGAVNAVAEAIEKNVDILNNSVTWFADNQDLIIGYALNIFFAVCTLIIGMMAARFIAGTLHKILGKRGFDSTIVDFVTRMVRYVIVAFVIIASLSKLGIETTSFVAIIGAAGLAVGLALQGSLSNFASGILIIALRPFKAGEYIEAAGTAGVVESVQIFSTTLTSPDNKFVVVPNSAILGGNIINYSRKPTRRIDLVIGVSYNADLAQTKAVLESVLNDTKGILPTPAPTIAVSELADSSVNLVVRPWVNGTDYWPIRFQLMESIKNALDEAGIEIPYPQMDVHMDK